jgi:hypothetical protein
VVLFILSENSESLLFIVFETLYKVDCTYSFLPIEMVITF